MRIKKLLLMMVLLTIAGRAFADDYLSVANVTMDAGKTQKVSICLNNTTTFNAFQLDLVLPDGITVAKNKKGKDDITLEGDRIEDHTLSINEPSIGTYRIVCASLNSENFYEKEGALLYVNLQASETASGEKTVQIKNIIFSEPNSVPGGSAIQHDLADVSFKVTVAGKPTVTADDKSRAYGDTNPELTYTVSGGTITETPVLTTTATATSPVGTYDIVVPASANYTAANGVLTVTKAPLTISGGTYSIKQGESLPTFTAEYSGFKNNETSAVLTAQPTLTLAAGVTGASAPGNYDITVAGATADNYEITFQKGTLTITEADPVTVTAKNYEITYGDALPDFGYTTEGATLNGEPTITCTATATSGAGTYPITITKGTVTNYNDSYVNGTLTIKKAALTIKADDKSKEYGEANPELTCTYSGFVKEETNAVLTTQPTLGTSATAASGAGTYDITITGAEADNYTFTYVDGKLTISQLIASLDWSNTELAYNGQEQKPTATVSNLVGNDQCTVTVSGATNAGNHTSTASELSNANYKLPEAAEDKSKAFNIAQLEASLDWSNTELTYNGQEQKPTATVSNLVGNDQCTVIVSGATNAGNHTSTASELGNANYKLPEAKTQAFAIAPAALTISCGTYTIKQGEALPQFQAEYNGFVNDETETVVTTKPTLTTTATSASARGSYEVTVSGAEAANYDITYQNGTLIVTEVVIADGGTTIEQGEDGYYVVTIDEEGGSNSENGVIGDTQLDNEGKIEVAELTYTRELDAPTGGTADVTIEGSEAKLYTTCLPEAPTTADNAKYYTLDAANNTTLTFVEVANSNLAANTPYLVAVTIGDDLNESQNVTNVTLKKEADNSVEKDGFVFKGTLTGLSNADAAAAGAYILQSGNVWGKVTTAKPTAYIPACRAYIVSTSATAPAILNGNLGDGTTRIQNIRTVDMNGTEHWYDLNGRRIQKPTKGINIQNGRKVVVK